MNTDKIYAEQLANEYAPKDTSKVVALRKLDTKAKLPATVFTYTFGIVTAMALTLDISIFPSTITLSSAVTLTTLPMTPHPYSLF